MSAPDAYQQSGKWGNNQTLLHSTMDVTRSVASPSDDIKKAAVFEKDALLSAQTMIYVRGRRPYAVRTPSTRHLPHAIDATRHRRDTPIPRRTTAR